MYTFGRTRLIAAQHHGRLAFGLCVQWIMYILHDNISLCPIWTALAVVYGVCSTIVLQILSIYSSIRQAQGGQLLA